MLALRTAAAGRFLTLTEETAIKGSCSLLWLSCFVLLDFIFVLLGLVDAVLYCSTC